MQRQLYGIGSLVDREKFGIGSKLKKFVRNIIPNEVSKVATTIAPFIAPFDPATAAVLSSVGSFDQTGRIGSSLKRGALTYAGGQAARYIGGAGFQALPGQAGFTGQSLLSPSAYQGGIMGALKPGTARGLTSPIGTETGLGKFLSGRGTPEASEIAGVDKEVYTVGSKADQAALEQAITGGDLAEAEAIRSSTVYGSDIPGAITKTATPTISVGDRVSSIMKGDDILGNAFELAKSGAKTIFTNKDGSIDKRAVIAAIAGAASYAEARAAAKELGTDITEEEYDEATKTEKLGEYQGYLQDFFKGKKDGGRIPFANGSEDPAPISGDELKKIIEEFMKNQEKEEQLRKKQKDGTNPMEDMGNMGVVTRGLPEEAYEQEDQSISYMDPKAKEKIFESMATMEPGSRMSVIEFMMKAGKMSEDDYNEFINRLQMGVEEEETRITKDMGGSAYTPEQVLKMKRILFQLDDNPDILVMDDEEIVQMYMQLAENEKRAKGGRIGYASGSKDPKFDPSAPIYKGINKSLVKEFIEEGIPLGYRSVEEYYNDFYGRSDEFYKDGGRIGFKNGKTKETRAEWVARNYKIFDREGEYFADKRETPIDLPEDKISYFSEQEEYEKRNKKAVGGIMDLPTGQPRTNRQGVNELDYRQSGGFVPIGIKERADDVPAMLSKNEFVMTADAVRGIGNGSVENGAQKLYNLMKEAEKVGRGVA